jgi:hypothetical protein
MNQSASNKESIKSLKKNAMEINCMCSQRNTVRTRCLSIKLTISCFDSTMKAFLRETKLHKSAAAGQGFGS